MQDTEEGISKPELAQPVGQQTFADVQSAGVNNVSSGDPLNAASDVLPEVSTSQVQLAFLRTPPEIWRRIFIELCAGNAENAASISAREEYVAAASSVCRQWRAIACGTSVLWEVITFSRARSPWNSVERVRASLACSGGRAIDVTFILPRHFREPDDGSDTPSMLPSMIVPHFHRIRSLRLMGDRGVGYESGVETGVVSEDFDAFFDIEETALTSLHVERLLGWCYDAVLYLTSASPQLVHLHIFLVDRFNWPAGDPEADVIRLSVLRTAALNAWVLHDALTSPGFEAPLLRDLTLFLDDHNNAAFLSEDELQNSPFAQMGFAASLESLTVIGYGYYVALGAVLETMPGLRTLRLEKTDADHVLIEFLCDENHVPKLEMLDVVEGMLEDEDVLHLLDVRDAAQNPRFATLMVNISESLASTELLGYELTRRGRGSWKP